MEKFLAGPGLRSANEVERRNSLPAFYERVINRRGRRGIRRGTQRQFCSATSAVNLLLAIAAVLIVTSPQAFGQEPGASPSPSPMVSAQQTLKVTTVAIDYRADANQPLPD